MLKLISGLELSDHPTLANSMFKDRASQFYDRLGWSVYIDPNGYEIDYYDKFNPLYLVWERDDGMHGGSMRFLPTTGNTMLNDHFSIPILGFNVSSPKIWECTRFCLSPDESSKVCASLILGAAEIMKIFSLNSLVGVFDKRMERVYRRLDVSPYVLARKQIGDCEIGVGLWRLDEAPRQMLECVSGIKKNEINAWSNIIRKNDTCS